MMVKALRPFSQVAFLLYPVLERPPPEQEHDILVRFSWSCYNPLELAAASLQRRICDQTSRAYLSAAS